MQGRIKALENIVNPAEKMELVMLNNSFVLETKKSKEQITVSSVKAWQSAKHSLEEFLEALEEKYGMEKQKTPWQIIQDSIDKKFSQPPEGEVPKEPIWESFEETKVQAEVLRYLLATGWDVRKQTCYNHIGSGKLQKNRGGLYTKNAVKKYAEAWLVHRGLGATVGESDENLAKTKTLAEIKRIETAEKRDNLKLEVEKGLYIPRDQVEKELAARVVVVDQSLEFCYRSKITEMVTMVGGDMGKAPLLLDLLIKNKNELMQQMASMDDFTIETL